MPPASVLYDSDCRFCSVVADALLSWDRRGRLRAVAIQSDEGQRLLAPVAPGERLDSFHLVDPDGTVRSAGPALTELLARLPGAAPLAALLGRAPRATTAGYAWIADHRIGISRFVPEALKDRAERRLAGSL